MSLQRAERDKRHLPKGHHTWNIIVSLGRGTDGKYVQKWHRFHGTRQQAEQKERDLRGDIFRGDYVEPTKLTVGEYLDQWVETSIKPRRATNTYTQYVGAISNHLKPVLGHIPLQSLSVLHVERYYASLKLAPASGAIHHSILTTALKAAVTKGLLQKNVASRVTNRPCVKRGQDVVNNVWTASEAQKFLSVVKQRASAQGSTFFALALDSGARKAELLGLRWSDLTDNSLRVERQMLTGGLEPKFIPPKRGGIRTIDLSDETVALLREHKREQSEFKMANRLRYHDQGLVFARENLAGSIELLGTALPQLALNAEMDKWCKAANVKRITVHGLRHTCATLLLAAGIPPHVVQRRLGHKTIEMTLNLYAHVLPSMQADAASRLATLLHG